MYRTCEKCKYNDDGKCDFFYMGSGNEIDMPCYREKELMKEAADKEVEDNEDSSFKDSAEIF